MIDIEACASCQAEIPALEVIRIQLCSALDMSIAVHVLHVGVDKISRITARMQIEILRPG